MGIIVPIVLDYCRKFKNEVAYIKCWGSAQYLVLLYTVAWFLHWTKMSAKGHTELTPCLAFLTCWSAIQDTWKKEKKVCPGENIWNMYVNCWERGPWAQGDKSSTHSIGLDSTILLQKAIRPQLQICTKAEMAPCPEAAHSSPHDSVKSIVLCLSWNLPLFNFSLVIYGLFGALMNKWVSKYQVLIG